MSDVSVQSAKARASLNLGLASFVLGLITGIPAVIQGFRGLWEIGRHPDRVRGRGYALAGIGMGVLGTTLVTGLVLLGIEKVRDQTDRMH